MGETEDMWVGGSGSRCQDCMTVSVKQGESEGGGSSGWLQEEVRDRRLWEVRTKSKIEGHSGGRKGLAHGLYLYYRMLGLNLTLKAQPPILSQKWLCNR